MNKKFWIFRKISKILSYVFSINSTQKFFLRQDFRKWGFSKIVDFCVNRKKNFFVRKIQNFRITFFLVIFSRIPQVPTLGYFSLIYTFFIDFLVDYTHRILIFNNFDRREFFCVNFCVNEAKKSFETRKFRFFEFKKFLCMVD